MTDALARAVEASIRKRRRDGILLTLIAAMFVAAGVFILFVVDNPWLAVISLSFFSTLLVIGIFQMIRPERDLPKALAVICCFGMAVSGVALILSELLGTYALDNRQGAALPVGIIVVLFFGGGGMLLVLKPVLGRRSPKRPKRAKRQTRPNRRTTD